MAGGMLDWMVDAMHDWMVDAMEDAMALMAAGSFPLPRNHPADWPAVVLAMRIAALIC
jgi:hypothetical protein